jgi:hypothetical protein
MHARVAAPQRLLVLLHDDFPEKFRWALIVCVVAKALVKGKALVGGAVTARTPNGAVGKEKVGCIWLDSVLLDQQQPILAEPLHAPLGEKGVTPANLVIALVGKPI